MVRRFFAPPVFEGDEEKTRAAELLNTILILLTLGTIISLLTIYLFGSASSQAYIATAAFGFLIIAMQLPMRRGYIKPVGVFIVLISTVSLTYTILIGGTIRVVLTSFYISTTIMSGLIISRRAIYWTAIINTVIVLGIIWLETNGYLPEPAFTVNMQQGIVFFMATVIVVLLLGTALRRLNESLEKARLGEENLSVLNAELEQRVNERTAELEKLNQHTSRRAAQLKAITELSETIAQLQDLNQLFPVATSLISERFGFYHVGIFLIDNDRDNAIMQASNSAGGQIMLARGHRLKLGTGVVGFAAQTGQPRIALDVGADAVFFNNPDLPTTRSEVALPLKSRGETFGVLDVQSTEAGAFSNEDLQVLTTLANQVSIAFENTRLLTETRAALKQVQEVYDEFTRAEWSRTAAKAEQAGFRYQAGRIEMIDKSLNSPEVVSAVETGAVVTNQTNESKAKRPTVAIPVKLRGEVIGILQIESNDSARPWQTDEISLVEAVAERAAFAMENARLFQDARKRASKERLISEATTKISGALSIENILRTTAQELERVLGGSEVLIQFKSEESK